MRQALLATLFLSPVLLHAQANSPAQTQIALAARPAAPAEAGAAGDRGTVTKPVRISTGVVAPKLVHSIAVNSETTSPWINVASNKTVTVNMIVDKAGNPTELKIVKSAGPIVDRSVLAAVSQYRFEPGTVSNQPVSFPLNLEVTLVPGR